MDLAPARRPRSLTQLLIHTLSTFPHDFRHAIRTLRTNPGFSAIAIATVALAIGANTAMFSFVHGLLLTPLPYPDPDRIAVHHV